MAMIEVRGVTVAYGSIPVLVDANVEIGDGEVVAVLGGNGAGKTTLVRAISGSVALCEGSVLLDGVDLKGVPEHERVAKGIGHVPMGRRIFGTMTVLENLKLGAHLIRKDRRLVAERMDRVFSFFPRLGDRKDQVSATMAGGEQQMLAIGRALMTDPRLLIVDEASLSLAPAMVDHVFDVLNEIHQAGASLLLVEQNARASLRIADRAYVLASGRIVFSGRAAEMATDPRLADSYLGAELALAGRATVSGRQPSSGTARAKRAEERNEP
ncbi:MAG: ABC transporter ATP-binding protein [Actinomycetota bacterium]